MASSEIQILDYDDGLGGGDTGKPDDSPDYYLCLLTSAASVYNKAVAAHRTDPTKQMFFIGKRDATTEAIKHYLELKRR